MFSYRASKYTAQDIEKLLTLFDPYSDKPFSFRDNPAFKDWPQKLSANATILTCNDETRVVGCIFYYDNELAIKNDEGYIVFFCVLPDYRRLGIASEMIKFLKMQLKDKGISHVRIRCAKKNMAAFKLYQKMSFYIVKDDDDGYFMVSET